MKLDLKSPATAMICPKTTPHRTVDDAHTPETFPGWVWVVYILLFATSIPWYISADTPLRIWLGLPHWVVISLLANLCVAGFTVFVVHRLWPENP
ncbi:MAG: hypothetical protein CL484_06135 [Acidobacteria bacterium]|nr:hypothetical protein [Acidobacteriota bacterium]